MPFPLSLLLRRRLGGKSGGEGRKRKDEDESEKSGLGWRRRKRPLYNVKGGRRRRAYEKRGPS